MRRAARFADVWYPIGSNQKSPLDTLPRFRAGIARLRQLVAEAGRDPAAVGLGYRVKAYGDAVRPTGSDGERRLFSGSEAAIIDDFKALRDLGVGVIDIDFERHTAKASIDEMGRFKDKVLAKV
jgi:alkanesulfonate monooxygenase SsuD/methylene tetrahydromethanopterin reductase-like flavin-dependent oxidoreductase (luciferase family)